MGTFLNYFLIAGLISILAYGLLYKRLREKAPIIDSVPILIILAVNFSIGWIMAPLYLMLVFSILKSKTKIYRLNKEKEKIEEYNRRLTQLMEDAKALEREEQQAREQENNKPQ